MASSADPTSHAGPSISTFEQLEQYRWDEDAEFQSGLSSILASAQTDEQNAETVRRAKCFYFSRKFNVPVDFDAYQSWLLDRPQPYLESSSNINGMSDSAGTAPATSSSSQSALPSATETPSSSEQAPYPTSFAQIVELISTGQPIPGIKEVPSTILEGQSSETTAQTRRKPWEKDEPATSEHAPSEAAPLTTAGE